MVAGYLSLLSSISEKPLEYWSKKQSRTGNIRKILDADLLQNVIEIQDYEQPNTADTSILCPPDISDLLYVELPVLVVVIKQRSTRCRVQVQVVDDQNRSHHFYFYEGELERHANLKHPIISRVKVDLEPGWNNLELDLANLTQIVFKCQYKATQRLEIGGCRLRRVYFLDRHYQDHEISTDLFHGFLDVYMLKWGIDSVERSTQTETKHKSKVRDGSSGNVKIGQKNPNGRVESIGSDLLSGLQAKSDKVIENFFGKQRGKVASTIEFKRSARIKPYAVPMKNEISERRFLSRTIFERINSIRQFTNACDQTIDCRITGATN